MKRRQFNKGLSLLGLSSVLPIPKILHEEPGMILRKIPASGEQIPVVGMGSWLTFDVAGNAGREQNMKSVLSEFHRLGGRVIDSSPMYGSSEEVIGRLADELGIIDDLWISTKIWTNGKSNGQQQLHASNMIFNNRVMVNHVHNTRDLEIHFDTLREAKAAGLIRYTAISHYLNSQHDLLGELILKYHPDFIQINYNIENTHAEKKLFPLAVDNGVAIIVNKPFQTGALFRKIGDARLPDWAGDFGIDNWAAYILKYILSHPAVTCVIPATTHTEHVRQNVAAGTGYLPTRQERDRMRAYFMSIL